jgi:thioesterase domain-containing protein/acyl carrier protein
VDRSNIHTIRPLSSLACALLYSRLESSGGDPGLLHISLDLRGQVDPLILRVAWQEITARHEALRSSVHWEATARPLQIVHKSVTAKFEHQTGGSRPFAGFKKEDWDSGVELTKAPIDRLTLVSHSGTEHTLLWTTHHLLLDGWSAAIILEELLEFYKDRLGAVPSRLKPVPKLDGYQAWLESRDVQAAEAFWSKYLKEFSGSVQFGGPPMTDVVQTFPLPTHDMDLTPEEEDQIRGIVATTGCTMNNVLLMAFSLCLTKLGRDDDVVIGVTTSGRPADLPDITRMTGMFTKTIPVRVKLDRSRTVRENAADLLRDQASWTKHGFLAVERMMEASNMTAGASLFDCILILENFPISKIESVEDLGFSVSGFTSTLTSTMPLAIAVIDGEKLRTKITYDRAVITAEQVDLIAETFKRSLLAVAKKPDRTVYEVAEDIPESELKPLSRRLPSTEARTRDEGSPGSQIELGLSRIWKDVLGIQQISPTDDFFDIGGRSLQAARLLDRIEREMGKRLPISAIFEGRTIRKMATVLRGDAKEMRWKSLIPIQPEGSQPPMFCMHAAEGNVNFCYDLAHRLGPDQPVYGLQSVGLSGEPPMDSVVQMAKLYASEIYSIQGASTCKLVGFCLGTAIAVEVAVQLKELGCQVETIIALDTSPIGPEKLTDHDQTASKIVKYLKLIARGDLAYVARRTRRLALGVGHHIRRTRVKLFGSDRDVWLFDVAHANRTAAGDYRGRPVPFPVLLIRSSSFVKLDHKSGHIDNWKLLAQRSLDIVEIESTHNGMVQEPYVGNLARAIQQHASSGGGGFGN